MDDRVMIYELPEFWQDKIRTLRAENRNLRARMKLADESGTWPQKLRKLTSEAKNLRARLRAAEARIAELEARLDA